MASGVARAYVGWSQVPVGEAGGVVDGGQETAAGGWREAAVG